MNIKKTIQEIIIEAAGVQIEVKNISEKLAGMAIKKVISTSEKHPKIKNGKPWTIIDTHYLSDNEEQKTKMTSVIMNIQFINSLKQEFSGQFNPSKAKTNGDGLFSIAVDVQIECPIDQLNDYKNNIRSVISHELNHAFVFLHDINKKSAAMNTKNRQAKLLSSKDEGVKMLSKVLYLTNPMEIQARIQDIGGLVDDLRSENASDALSELLLYAPFRELVDLNRMKLDNIEITDAVIEFVHQMKGGETQAFIKELDKKRNNSVTEALRKVYRLISDRYSVNEDFITESSTFDFIYEWNCYSWS